MADDARHFETKLQPGQHHQNAVYAAMVKSLDDSVGRVLDHLKKRGLEQNTIVLFTSDNGGYIGTEKGQTVPVTSNAPLRSGKGSLYEGGIRVPLIVRWSGVTPEAAECRQPVILMDLYHTLTATLSNAKPTGIADGIDLKALLQNPVTKLNRYALYFHYPHYYATTTPVSAFRAGDWKLLEYLEDGHLELYNLRDDPSEQTDLAAQMPDKAASLLKQLRDWRTQVGAAMPLPNSAFK
jgi:arylsulfatase A-like enzyme